MCGTPDRIKRANKLCSMFANFLKTKSNKSKYKHVDICAIPDKLDFEQQAAIDDGHLYLGTTVQSMIYKNSKRTSFYFNIYWLFLL